MSDSGRPMVNPNEIASKSFEIVRRGFDTTAVRELLVQVAAEIRSLQARQVDLERRVAEVPVIAPPVEVDEESLVGAVGIETARILQAAHDAARDIVARAERRAAALVADAEGAFAERTRLADAEAAELRASVRDEVLSLQQKAREECRDMVDEAREARRRILSDLVDRRRTLHLQLEQMRAGKDALADVIESVSYSLVSSIEEVRTRIDGSEESARAAAAAAVIDPHIEEELALDAIEVAAVLGTGRSDSDPHGAHGVLAAVSEPAIVSSVDVPPSLDPNSPLGETTGGPGDGGSPGEDVVAETDATSGPPEDLPEGLVERDGSVGEPSDIDELFARIRSSRSDTVAAARQVLDTPVDRSVPEDPTEITGEETNEEFSLLVRRDQLLGPAVSELSRSLKRALRLEENELRDSARHLPKDPDALLALVQPSTLTRIVDAAERSLAQARQAGATFVGELLGTELADVPGDEPRMVAERLAHEIVDPLRLRIESALRESEGEGDPSAAVGIAFRDWRGSRVEAVAGDFATWSFTAGAIAVASAHDAKLSWVVDDGDSHCPDCEDNALAGALAPGSEYPTGHAHPPIHPGCRCLLVPSSTAV